tara:strand:+ start:650 stop:1144 length:495 start_codon:yes stop_codon:yes gene_type:complete
MVKFIFDLDLTLYSETDYVDNESERKYYNSFKKKNFVKQLLTQIPHNKYILTNANLAHASVVLKKTNLLDLFNDIISSDMANSYKPYRIIYDMAIKEFAIEKDETVYFFEDQVDNLKTAKKLYNWTTILISPEKTRKNKFVDYVFTNIEEALLFFIVKDKIKFN